MINQDLFVKNIKTMLEDDGCGAISDGESTFNDLYTGYYTLICALLNNRKAESWKADYDSNGYCWQGYFIAGINTPNGPAVFYIPLQYKSMINLREMNRAPRFDDNAVIDAIHRIRKSFDK